MEERTFSPADCLYSCRDNFVIVGLTGHAGSGCSTLANIMADGRFMDNQEAVRKPADLPFTCNTHCINTFQSEESSNIKATSQLVFKREYAICHNFSQKNYQPYRIVKYTRAVLLYVILYACEVKHISGVEQLKQLFRESLQDKFYPSHNPRRDVEFKKIMDYSDNTPVDIDNILNNLQWDDLWNSLSELPDKNYIAGINGKDVFLHNQELSAYFFDNAVFNQFADDFVLKLSQRDYYSLCFMFHRFTACIRNCGNPFVESQYNYDNLNKSYDHLFDIVRLINYIIKGLKYHKKAEGRRIVIDSIRNSMEAMFLKERYTAFYLVAVHDDKHCEEHFLQKVKSSVSPTVIEQEENKEKISLMFHSLKSLMDIEIQNSDFEEGKFHAPNVGQCIADAEIHISNESEINVDALDFHTMAEQWMKYSSLILHPGLITPSSEERCMIVAYTAKFNSGCLSRQVGACITNQYHAIRTIGWNDVPYGQIPCALRELSDIISPSGVSSTYYRNMYSSFEQGKKKVYEHGKYSFKEQIGRDYQQIDELKKKLHGLPLSYCFKSLHNRYEGEKNQVYTRSLHAEENAMMQMTKYGGEALLNGIIYVTASPCELCAKKLYQIGVRKIVYIDPYPGISRQHIISSGFKKPALKLFQGAYGTAYFKLYQPFMSYKDEICIRTGDLHEYRTNSQLLNDILNRLGKESKTTYTQQEYTEILNAIKEVES